MKRSQLIAVLVGIAAMAALASPAHARLYMMMHGSNVYPGVATPVPPAAGGYGVPHAGVNVYPNVPTPMPHPDGPNLYQYVRSNPVKLFDPMGLWGEDLHHDATVKWAEDVGYTNNNCAEIIGKACNAVDWTFGGKAPRPFIGDMSYHFDYDKDGITPVRNARQKNVDKHLANAKELAAHHAQWVKTKAALVEIGTALHPLQDMFSHKFSHSADTPFTHAPQAYCAFALQDPWGTREPWCINQRQTNPNWSDPHRPDRMSLWPADVAAAERATKKVLQEFLKYETIRCRCAPDSR